MGKHLKKVDILGASFTIKSEDPPEHIKQLVDYLERQIGSVQQAMPLVDPLKVAVVAALNIVDELFKERALRTGTSGDIDSQELEQITQKMIWQIEDTLGEAFPVPPPQ